MAAEACLLSSGVCWGQIEPFGRFRIAFGQAVFATTDTSVTLHVPFSTIFAIAITPAFTTAAQAANGQLTYSVTPDSSLGTCAVTSNQITVKRIAGTDSALSFSVIVIGR